MEPPPGERRGATGFVLRWTTRRRAGKPYGAARLRRDRIVAYVRDLQRTEPDKMDEVIVPKAAAFFGTSNKTIWNALREDHQLAPYGIVDLGPMTGWSSWQVRNSRPFRQSCLEIHGPTLADLQIPFSATAWQREGDCSGHPFSLIFFHIRHGISGKVRPRRRFSEPIFGPLEATSRQCGPHTCCHSPLPVSGH